MKLVRCCVALMLVCTGCRMGGYHRKDFRTCRRPRQNEGLPGANVVVVGGNTGASTDPDGAYVIMNLQPGTYQLRITLVGYGPVSINQVKVTTDQTTIINASMTSSAVQLADVVIQAERADGATGSDRDILQLDERTDPYAAGQGLRGSARHASRCGPPMARRSTCAADAAMRLPI